MVLRNDKLFITLILSLVVGALFSMSFIDIAFCVDEYNNINMFVGTYSSPWNETQFRIETSLPAFSCLSSSGSFDFQSSSGVTMCEEEFYESFYTMDELDNGVWYNRFSERLSSYRSFTYHGLNYHHE